MTIDMLVEANANKVKREKISPDMSYISSSEAASGLTGSSISGEGVVSNEMSLREGRQYFSRKVRESDLGGLERSPLI